MSSVPTFAAPISASDERRAHPRRRLDQLAYIGFGPDSGGVLLDISEGGLRCQIIGPVVEGDLCHLKFALPGHHLEIETDGQVVWSNRSKQGGGVRLLGLGADVRQQLQQWISSEIASAGARPPAPIPIRTRSVGAVHAPRRTSETVAPMPAGETPAAQLPLSSPDAPHPPAQHESQQRMPLAIAHAQPKNQRTTRITVIAGCIVVGAVALAFSDFNLARLTGLSRGESRSDIAGPATATTAEPVASVTGAGPQPEAEAQRQDAKPASASGTADRSSRIASVPARPELPIAGAAPAPANRPVQSPPSAEPANRGQLAMALPRPRATSPTSPPDAAPEPFTPAIAPAPAPLMDMQAFESNVPELPQPVRPQAGANYQQPQLVSRVEPVYSPYARDGRLQGTVLINVTIGADGVPRSLARVSGNSTLAEMAFDAVRRWRYQPALMNGQPVESQTVISFTFQLR